MLLVSLALNATAQGTAFTYQGRLSDSGAPANAAYNFRFAVYDAVTNGTRVSVLLTNSSVPVSNGLFTVTLEFGAGVFLGPNYWLDIAVAPGGGTNYTTLAPRQPVLPVPYAMFSASASNLLGTLPAPQLTGTLPSAQISGTYSSQVNYANASNTFTGAFTGTGAALTNLNASQLTSGTVADLRLSTNVALLDHTQTFTGPNTFTASNNFTGGNAFTNRANNFTGTFTGNGAALTNLNGSQIISGTVADARLTTNVSLLDHSQTNSGDNTFIGDNTFTGTNSFNNLGNSFTGSFYGNGLVGWNVVSSNAVQAVIDHGYVLTSPQFTTVTMPVATNVSVGDIVRISGAGAGGWRAQANTNQSFLGNFSSYRNSPWFVSSVGGGQWYSLASSADGTRMYAAGSLGVEASTDAGHNWGGAIPALAGSWNSVATSADGLTVLAAVPSKAVQISFDAGTTWGQIGSVLASNAVAVACSSDANKAIVSNNGITVYTNNPSSVWSSIGAGAGTWNVVAYAGSGNNYAAGSTAGKIVTLIGGAVSPTNKACTGIVISADGTKLAACFNPGGIYTSTNGGASWTNSAAPWTTWNCLAASANCNQLFAGINNGVIYASGNFGANWTSISGVSNSVWSALAVSADASKLAAGASGSGTGLFYSSASTQSTTSTNGVLSGSQGTAVELQCIGNNQFMPVSSAGALWSN